MEQAIPQARRRIDTITSNNESHSLSDLLRIKRIVEEEIVNLGVIKDAGENNIELARKLCFKNLLVLLTEAKIWLEKNPGCSWETYKNLRLRTLQDELNVATPDWKRTLLEKKKDIQYSIREIERRLVKS